MWRMHLCRNCTQNRPDPTWAAGVRFFTLLPIIGASSDRHAVFSPWCSPLSFDISERSVNASWRNFVLPHHLQNTSSSTLKRRHISIPSCISSPPLSPSLCPLLYYLFNWMSRSIFKGHVTHLDVHVFAIPTSSSPPSRHSFPLQLSLSLSTSNFCLIPTTAFSLSLHFPAVCVPLVAPLPICLINNHAVCVCVCVKAVH